MNVVFKIFLSFRRSFLYDITFNETTDAGDKLSPVVTYAVVRDKTAFWGYYLL